MRTKGGRAVIKQEELKDVKSCPFSRRNKELKAVKPIVHDEVFLDLKRSKKKRAKISLCFTGLEMLVMGKVN